jgi:4-hydroxybenzoate polyprenyltransferase
MTFYLLGGGALFSWFGLGLVLWVILAHWWTFGQNSLSDATRVSRIGELPYDATDKEGKSHHPLITGEISIDMANNVIYFGLIVLVGFAVLLSYYSGGNFGLSMGCLSLYLMCGFAYNCGLNKSTIFSFIPISLCFAFQGLWAYFLFAKTIEGPVIFLFLYIILLEVYENNVEGGIKEIQTSEVNTMRYLGAEIKNGNIKFSLGSLIWSWGLKLCSIFIAGCILCYYTLNINIFIGLLFWLFAIIMIYFCKEILKSGEWNRNKALKNFSIEEITSIYLMPIILMPIIGYIEAILLMAFGIVYFVAMNKVNWGCWFPRV